MENKSYNSLEERLIQSGIIKQGNEPENIFEKRPKEEEISSFVEIPEDFQKAISKKLEEIYNAIEQERELQINGKSKEELE